MQFKVIGTRPIRHDGVDKVTGRAVYGADVRLPGMPYGKILRSPHAHARIKSIDVEAAETAGRAGRRDRQPICRTWQRQGIADLGESVNLAHLSDNVLARRQGALHGPRRGGRGGDDSSRRRGSVRLIKVDYEVLPPVLDGRGDEGRRAAAAARTAHQRMGKRGETAHQRGQAHSPPRRATSRRLLPRPTWCRARVVSNGHRASGLHRAADADGAVERRRTHISLDHHARAFSVRDADGRAAADARFARHRGADRNRRRVRRQESRSTWSPVAALLSEERVRPVKMVMTRDEVLEGTGPTPARSCGSRWGQKRRDS